MSYLVNDGSLKISDQAGSGENEHEVAQRERDEAQSEKPSQESGWNFGLGFCGRVASFQTGEYAEETCNMKWMNG